MSRRSGRLGGRAPQGSQRQRPGRMGLNVNARSHDSLDELAQRTPFIGETEAGRLAGSTMTHMFMSMTYGLGGAQCLLCFDWVDAPQHYLPHWYQRIQDDTVKHYEDRRWR